DGDDADERGEDAPDARGRRTAREAPGADEPEGERDAKREGDEPRQTAGAELTEEQHRQVVVVDAEEDAGVEDLRAEVTLPGGERRARRRGLAPGGEPFRERALVGEEGVGRVEDGGDAARGLALAGEDLVDGDAARRPGADEEDG